MPGYVTGRHETEVRDDEECEKPQLTIESTDIRNSFGTQLTFMFKAFVVSEDTRHRVFTSTKTILDRPCWRDDTVTLHDSISRHKIEVYTVCNSKLKHFDTLDLEPMQTIKKAFLTTAKKTLTMRSKEGFDYTLCISWRTPEYIKHVDGRERERAIASIKNQLLTLSTQHSQLT